jgi:hypothetical protein
MMDVAGPIPAFGFLAFDIRKEFLIRGYDAIMPSAHKRAKASLLPALEGAPTMLTIFHFGLRNIMAMANGFFPYFAQKAISFMVCCSR